MGPGAVRGRFTDGKSAEDRIVDVAIDGGMLVVSGTEGELARFSFPSLRVDALGEGVVHVEFADAPGALLSVEDPQFRVALRRGGVAVGGTPEGRRALWVGIVCLTVFAALMGGLYFSMPLLATAIARRIPVSVERNLAPKMEGMLAARTCERPGALDSVRKLRERLDPAHELEVDIHVVNLPFANAFALPGNVVLLTRGLLEEAHSADEIAGVLAHELAHVQHRHALSHMIRKALLAGLWIATIGDYSGMMVVDPKTAYETATLKYSRDAEAEADETGLRTLTERRISAKGLVDFLERNSKGESGGAAWLSTHPASAERMQRLSHQDLTGPAAPALDDDSLYELRKACEGTKAVGSLREVFF